MVGNAIEGIIGNLLDVPEFRKNYKMVKDEYMEMLKSRISSILKKIVRDCNDAINYFGKRADIDIDQHNYELPIEEEENNSFLNEELIELLNLDGQ